MKSDSFELYFHPLQSSGSRRSEKVELLQIIRNQEHIADSNSCHEETDRLTDCVNLNELSIADLKCIARFGLDAKINKFGVDCVGRFLRKGPPLDQTTRVPACLRPIRARSTKIFSTTFCCYKISEHKARKRHVKSNEILSISGKSKWHLEVGFFTRRDEEWVSCFLDLKYWHYVMALGMPDNFGLQLYVVNKDNDKMFVSGAEYSMDEVECDRDFGHRLDMKWADLDECVDKRSDSVTFGATFYLETLRREHK